MHLHMYMYMCTRGPVCTCRDNYSLVDIDLYRLNQQQQLDKANTVTFLVGQTVVGVR